MAFTSAQQVQINRLPSGRKAEMILAKLEKYSVLQLRALVNITSVAGGVVNYSGQNDYTVAERTTIADELKEGDKWLLRVPVIVAAGLSLSQRIKALEDA